MYIIYVCIYMYIYACFSLWEMESLCVCVFVCGLFLHLSFRKITYPFMANVTQSEP